MKRLRIDEMELKWYLDIQFVFWTLLLSTSVTAEPGVLQEYCEDATFHAKCPPDHVVMLEEARYGRMRTGQCLSTNYGSIGCSNDVLHVMDRFCSGRRSCDVNVRDLVVEATKPCPRDLRSFLEARYSCLPVVNGGSDCCASSSQARLRQTNGHIASIETEESDCGSIDCPWLIEMSPGQKINISLYEFALPSMEEMKTVREKMPPFSKVCHVYAIIKEKAVGSALTLCAGDERYRHLYTSTTNAVEIRIFTKKKLDREAYFVLKYDAIGCARPEKPSHGWVKMHGDKKAEIGCGRPEKVWKLVCHGNRWLGESGNCTGAHARTNAAGVLDNILSLSPDLSIVVIALVAMAIALVILVVGVVCLRKKWTRTTRRTPSQRGSPCTNVMEAGDVNKNNTLLNPANNGGHNYFRTWELHRHGQGRPPAIPVPEVGTMAAESQLGSLTQPDGGEYGVRYVEHVYESPTFHRRDVSEFEDPAQYYELDPEAEVFTPRKNTTNGESSSSQTNSAMPSQRCSFPGMNVHDTKNNSAGSYTS